MKGKYSSLQKASKHKLKEGENVKILISIDDAFKDIRILWYSGLEGVIDPYMEGVQKTLARAIEVARVTNNLITFPLAGWFACVLVKDFRESCNRRAFDYEIDLKPEYDNICSMLAITGWLIGKSIEKVIGQIYPKDICNLKVLSMNWVTKEQIILEVRL